MNTSLKIAALLLAGSTSLAWAAGLICVPEVNLPPGAPLATACSGAMLLAEAGLLAGCDATTHPRDAAGAGQGPEIEIRCGIPR